jgi:hypothetical protein
VERPPAIIIIDQLTTDSVTGLSLVEQSLAIIIKHRFIKDGAVAAGHSIAEPPAS